MKKILKILSCILLFTNCNAQKISFDTFQYNDSQITYSIIQNLKGPVQNFYVILSGDEEQINNLKAGAIKCITSNDRAYLAVIPKAANKEEFLLEFISHISNRAKLIDSNLIIISDDDYTFLYNSTRNNNDNQYKHGYLNNVTKYYLFKNITDICKVLK